MMKQIHLKLLVCLLLAISAAAQYNNNPIQWGSNVQGQPYSNNWPGAAANWPSASANWLGASANWPGASANWPGASANWPYGRYGQPANVLQYGVDYGQFNSGSQMVQPTYNQQTRVETNGADSAGAAEEIDSLISVPAPNRGGKDNSCYSIMDPLYPLFSLHCSALPQTTFSLPNFFGHTTKQETNELFTLFRPLLNSGCFRQMPKFLCPLFFPSCSKERILPCAKFCRDIQSRCRDSYISTIDCDLLPEKSEFCPRIAETSRSTNDTQDRYRSASENEKIPQPFVSIDYSDNSSAQSSVIQSSSTNNAAQKHVNSDASYGGMSSSASSDFSATNIKPTPVPKIISTVSELSNLNQDGTYNQQWTIGGLSSSGNNNNYVAGSFGSNIIASADSSPAGKIGNSAVESSEAKTIEFAGTSSYGNNNNAAGTSSYGNNNNVAGVSSSSGNVAGISSSFGSNNNAAATSYGNNNNAAGLSSLSGNVAGVSSSFGSNNNVAGTSSYGNNNNVAGVLSSSGNVAGVLSSSGNVAGVSSSSGNVAGVSSSFGSNNNVAGTSSYDNNKNVAGVLSSSGNVAGVLSSSGNVAGVSSSSGNVAGVSSSSGNVAGVSSSFGSNNNVAGTSSYGNNNNVAGVLSSSGNVAGVSSSSGNVAGISSSFGSNNNAAGVSSSSGRIKNTAGILSSFGSNSNAAGVAASSNINNSRNTGQISSSNSYVASGRFEQTGIPYGLQSTVEYLYYYPEKLDLSKCGPPQTKNPCTINGPQLYPIPGYPQCYIQCAFGLMFVKPCPGDLVWNALINVCDWSTVPDPVDDNNSDDLSNSNNNPKSPSYHSSRREKRSLNQLKKIAKENNPFPNFKRLNVPLGPPAPGYTPLPGFSGPIGIAGPYASPPAAPQSAPTMIYPFGPIQYPTLSHDMSRSIFSPPLQQTVPQQVLSPPLPPPMPPPIYTRLPPLNKPIVSPPVMPNYYSPYMWPSSPMNYPMVRSPVMPQPTFPQQIMYPSIYPPIWQPPQTPKLPPFIPPILPSLPIPLGGPLLPPLPMKIPATFIPGPPPIFSDSSFGPFDQPQVSSDGSSTGGQSVSAKGPEIIFSTSELMDRLHYNGNIGFPPLHGAPGGSSWATNLYGGFPGQFPPIGIYGKIKGSQSSKKQGSTNNNDDNDEDEDEKPNSSNEDEDEDEDEDKDEDDSNTSKASPNNKNDNSKSDNDSDEQDNSRKKRQVVSDDDENTLLSVENDGASPCIGKSINVNVRHPTDPTKYISCLNENKYEIMNCPTSFIYNADDDKCEKINIKSICEQEQPCMNNGECHSTSPTTFTCTCQGLWTGERCEIPVSSCASNPCGEGNQCHTLVTSDYKQDYICICDKQQSYGLTCTHNTVPNPCMGVFNNQERFYPFAFNSRAFLQCDGDLLHVRPCAPGLHWNQETKVCDRVESPSFIRPTRYKINQNTQSETIPTHPFISSDYRYQDYYPRIPSNDLRYNTYQETPTTYPMFSPSSTIKGSRRLKHKQRLMSNNIHASPYDQDSTVADQQYAQSFNQLPPNSFVSSPPQRHLFRLFQSPSSYRR
ncbi:unnamed protein product [Rotaria socialis]